MNRINRLTFSLWASGTVLVYFLAVASLFKAGSAFLMFIYVLASAVLLILGARRIHDIGFSGWFVLLAFVPLVNIALLGALVLVPGKADRSQACEASEAKGGVPTRAAKPRAL